MLIDLASGLSPLHCLAEVIELTGIVMVTRPSEACVRATHDALKTIAHDKIAVLGLIENMLGFNCDSCHTVRPLFPQGNFPGLAQTSRRRFSDGFHSIRGWRIAPNAARYSCGNILKRR